MNKKIFLAIGTGLMLLTIFLGSNMVDHSLSYPPGTGACNDCHTTIGYASCTQCHNDPALARSVESDESLDIGVWPDDIGYLNDDGWWSQNTGVWAEYRNFSRVYVHMMPSSNFIPGAPYNNPDADPTTNNTQIQFLVNSTHIVVRARIVDPIIDKDSRGTSDKFAIMFNIDTEGGILSHFIESRGNMQTSNGKIDMWYWDAQIVEPNGTGVAKDMYVGEGGYVNDGASNQDVLTGVHHGRVFENPKHITYYGYWIYFARELTTDDPNDVQFIEGKPIEYAIAYWNASDYGSHLSSWEHYLVVGDNFDAIYHTESVTITDFQTEVQTDIITSIITQAATGDGFAGITTVLGLVVVIPIAIFMKRKK